MLNLLSKVVIALGVVNAAYLNAASPMIWAMPSARSGGLRPEPISVVPALRAPAAIAKGAK